MEIKVKVSDAIAVLKENHEKHINEYKEKLAEWRKAVAKYTEDLARWFKDEKDEGRPPEPPRPRNYLGDYDRLINKLSWHTDETIVLSDYEYNMIFEDSFQWKNNFKQQNYVVGDYTGTLGTARAYLGNSTISASHIKTSTLNFDMNDGLHVDIDEDE